MTGTEPSVLPTRPVVGLHHIALAALEPARAEHYYTATVGCQPWAAAAELGLPCCAATLSSPNAGLVLLQADTAAPAVRRPVNEAGIAHLCLQTPDIAGVVGRMQALGAQLHSEPIDLGTGFLYCYARDPEFNVVEVECVAPVWADPRPWIAHANIVTPDLPRLANFYSSFLAAAAVRSPRLRNDPRLDAIADLPAVQVRAAWLDADNVQIELMQYLQPATGSDTGRRTAGAPGFAHLAFEVSGLTAACDHLSACGGQLDSAPVTGAWQAWGADPDGNRLLLLDLQSPARESLRIAAMVDPRITHRFAAARAALMASA